MTKLLKSLTALQILLFAGSPLAALARHIDPNIQHVPAKAVGVGTVVGWLNTLGDWIFTAIMALAAIILLIGAFGLLTSGGDATKISSAKNLIIWGIIGVIIAILAKGLLTLACSFVGFVC